MKKRILAASAAIILCAPLWSCDGNFNAADAETLQITANGYQISIASAKGDKGYDALVDACGGFVHIGKLEDCHFGDIELSFKIDGEIVNLYPCTDEGCKYIAKGDYSGKKIHYIKIDQDERKAIIDFVEDYTK